MCKRSADGQLHVPRALAAPRSHGVDELRLREGECPVAGVEHGARRLAADEEVPARQQRAAHL